MKHCYMRNRKIEGSNCNTKLTANFVKRILQLRRIWV